MFLMDVQKMTKAIQKTLKYNIDMKPIKRFAAERLSESPLKKVLLLEDDKLDVHIFLARLPVYLNLINILER